MEMALAPIRRLQTDLEVEKDLELFRFEQSDSPVVVTEIDRLLEEKLIVDLQDADGVAVSFLGVGIDDGMRKYSTVQRLMEGHGLWAFLSRYCCILVSLSLELLNAVFASSLGVPWRSFEDPEYSDMELAPVTPESAPERICGEDRETTTVRRLFDVEPPEAVGCRSPIPPLSPWPEVLTAPSVFPPGFQDVQFCSSGSVPSLGMPSWTEPSSNFSFLQVATRSSAFVPLEAMSSSHPPTVASSVLHAVLPLSPGCPSHKYPLAPAPPSEAGKTKGDALLIQPQFDLASRSVAVAFPAVIPGSPLTPTVTTSSVVTVDSSIGEEPASTGVECPLKFSAEHCSKWVLRLSQVQAFVTRHGHCRIPQVYPEDPDLGQWAKRQRFQYKRYMKEVPGKSSMTKERIAILDDLGFCWDVQKEQWEEMYLKLVKHIQTHGDLNVHRNTGLAMWINRQRRIFQTMGVGNGKNCLSIDRFQRLDAVGFDWYIMPRRTGVMKGSKYHKEKVKKRSCLGVGKGRTA